MTGFSAHSLPVQYALDIEVCGPIGFPESYDTPRLFEQSGGNPAAMKRHYLFAALFYTCVVESIGFEFGFPRPLHVVATRPDDWERPPCDLTDFIRHVNEVTRPPGLSKRRPDESPPLRKPSRHGSLKKGRPVRAKRRSLSLINMSTEAMLRALAPVVLPSRHPNPARVTKNPLGDLPEPFAYELRPGEGIVLIAER